MFDAVIGSLNVRNNIQEKMKMRAATKTGRKCGRMNRAIARSEAEKIKIVMKTFCSAKIGRPITNCKRGTVENTTKNVGIFSMGLTRDATAIKPKIAPDAPTKGERMEIPSKSLLKMSKIAAMQPDEM